LHFLLLCLYFIHTCFFVLIVLHFAFLSFTYNTQHKHPCSRRDTIPQPSRRLATGIGIRTPDFPARSLVACCTVYQTLKSSVWERFRFCVVRRDATHIKPTNQTTKGLTSVCVCVCVCAQVDTHTHTLITSL
jgi:hypothetical protein